MSKKLYNAKTQSGHCIWKAATLECLQNEIEFNLNDVINTDMLQVGEQLGHKLKLKKIAQEFYERKDGKDYLVTIEREM